ncbi:MAG: ABC transporter permease [Verrucomicrobiales bacterium]|nr:ABC transporter permease [Verrucomicrobiales bacterium]
MSEQPERPRQAWKGSAAGTSPDQTGRAGEVHFGAPLESAAGEPKAGLPLSPNQRAWQRFKRNRAATFCSLFLATVVTLILSWPLFRAPSLAPYLPQAMTFPPASFATDPFQGPGQQHWFGTDAHGRDLLSRVVYGARISLLVGAVGALVSLVIGVWWGAVAGYVGGRWDDVMMRFVDVLYSLPSIIFVIVLTPTLEGFFQTGLRQWFSSDSGALARMLCLFAGLGAVSWLTMARIVRGQVLSLRSRAFVDASRALGASHSRILFRHILPNVSGVVIVYLMLMVPSIILYESFLSYLGLGIQPPQASLGSLMAEGASQINPLRIYWWMVFFPGATLVTTLLALNFLGDGLRDAFDPRGAGRGDE